MILAFQRQKVERLKKELQPATQWSGAVIELDWNRMDGDYFISESQREELHWNDAAGLCLLGKELNKLAELEKQELNLASREALKISNAATSTPPVSGTAGVSGK